MASVFSNPSSGRSTKRFHETLLQTATARPHPGRNVLRFAGRCAMGRTPCGACPANVRPKRQTQGFPATSAYIVMSSAEYRRGKLLAPRTIARRDPAGPRRGSRPVRHDPVHAKNLRSIAGKTSAGRGITGLEVGRFAVSRRFFERSHLARMFRLLATKSVSNTQFFTAARGFARPMAARCCLISCH